MGKLQVVVGGQYGSEGKGMVTGYLAEREDEPLLAVRVAGPNAGHTVIDEKEQRFAFRHLPVAAVVNPGAKLALAAGSEIDEAVLHEEIATAQRGGHEIIDRLFVDSQATVLEKIHAMAEQNLAFGTTGKGIGAARADRVMRRADLAMSLDAIGFEHEDVAEMQRMWLRSGGTVQVEGTQGYGLGLHAGHYPHCTSSDCRAIDMLAMAGISPWDADVEPLEVWVVLRTYPIRIAGNSGPMLREMEWEELRERSGGYIEPEYTTVTKKMRRIGEWDDELAASALEANGGPDNPALFVAITFLDYLFPSIRDVTRKEDLPYGVRNWIDRMANRLNCFIGLVGTGPRAVVDLR